MTRSFSLLLVLLLAAVGTQQGNAGIGDFFKRAQDAAGVGGGLSDTKIIDGLKEALEIGTSNAVATVSQAGGYYDNPTIRIPIPVQIEKAESLFRAAGYGSQLDAFEKSMNSAAEIAAPQAKGIFLDAIKEMSISDARSILDGPDDAATNYFKEKTYDRLGETFKPVVHKSMSEVGVTRNFQSIDEKAKQMPFVGGFSFDLDQYVTDGALNGLFSMVAQEEKKIRQDPEARVTGLLKEVFGSN